MIFVYALKPVLLRGSTPYFLLQIWSFETRLSDTRVVFDPTYPSVYMSAFIKTDWKSMYGDVEEIIPPGAPVPHGKEID
jgi:hypothetical protein